MSRPLGLAGAITLVGTAGVAAWGAGITRRFFDYDEIYHAHATWLIAQGLTPFQDFQASHSPFLWYPLAALWRVLPDSPASLVPMRLVSSVGTLLSVLAMAASFRAERRELHVGWLTLGVAAVTFHREMLDYSLEFRPDSWSTALLFLAFACFLHGRPASTAGRYACFGGLASLAVLASPKLVVLPVLFAVIDLARRTYRREALGRPLFGYALGIGGALLLGLAFLRLAGIDASLAFDMAIRYQWVFERRSGFGRGLLASVVEHVWLLALVAAGMAAWAAHLVRERQRPTAYELAVLLFLAVQVLLVDRPYKQYYGPWFLLAAGFVPWLAAYPARTRPRIAPWCLGLAALLGAGQALSALQGFARSDQAHQMLAFYDTLLRLAPADAPVVAYPPLHPVVRRDVFYGWSRTTDPGGNGTEAIMDLLDVPGYSARFDSNFYRQEIEARPPALIVAPRDDGWGYEPRQWAVLREYLAVHPADYLLVDRDVLQPLWLRRDLVERDTRRLRSDAGR